MMESLDSSSKWHERSTKAKYEEGRDRISSLPDKVLVHILSFLPTKHAVGTSILSHRWQYLFTLTTNLDFDESLTFHQRGFDRKLMYARLSLLKQNRDNSGNGLPELKYQSNFKDFVDRVLILHKSPNINKFRLKCELGSDCSNVNSWIMGALLRGVSDLDVNTCDYESSILPCSLFTSKTLVVLKLRGEFEMRFPTSILLPNLKSLHIDSVKFSEDCSLNRLISGCPMLGDLVIGGGWEDVKVIDISSTTLTTLTMDFSEGFTSRPFHRHSVTLDLPNLLKFNYVDYLARNYLLKNMNSLEEARIDILLDVENLFMQSDTFSGSVLGLMNGISNAKHLYFSGKCMEALDCDQFELPVFRNLTRLELGWSRCIYWRGVLREFLHSSPVLEDLFFAEGLLHRESDADYDEKNFWSKKQKTPPCLSSHLKTVTIDSFHGFEEEVNIAKYFLKHGKVLKELRLDWQIGSKKEYNDLMKLVKASKTKDECPIRLVRL